VLGSMSNTPHFCWYCSKTTFDVGMDVRCIKESSFQGVVSNKQTCSWTYHPPMRVTEVACFCAPANLRIPVCNADETTC
jgi:hypothetical protein